MLCRASIRDRQGSRLAQTWGRIQTLAARGGNTSRTKTFPRRSALPVRHASLGRRELARGPVPGPSPAPSSFIGNPSMATAKPCHGRPRRRVEPGRPPAPQPRDGVSDGRQPRPSAAATAFRRALPAKVVSVIGLWQAEGGGGDHTSHTAPPIRNLPQLSRLMACHTSRIPSATGHRRGPISAARRIPGSCRRARK